MTKQEDILRKIEEENKKQYLLLFSTTGVQPLYEYTSAVERRKPSEHTLSTTP
jgi:hypothetical protein